MPDPGPRQTPAAVPGPPPMLAGVSSPLRRKSASSFVALHAFSQRARCKAFALLAGPAFAEFGAHSAIAPPVRLAGVHRIAVGRGVWIGAGSWLQTIGEGEGVAIVLGDGFNASGAVVLSAAQSLTIGANVLFARNVYVADHSHAFGEAERAVIDQGIDRVAPVEIGEGAWLGQNVVVGPGVRIGRGAVIGANSVVLDDVPDRAVAVGAPARVVRRLDPTATQA